MRISRPASRSCLGATTMVHVVGRELPNSPQIATRHKAGWPVKKLGEPGKKVIVSCGELQKGQLGQLFSVFSAIWVDFIYFWFWDYYTATK